MISNHHVAEHVLARDVVDNGDAVAIFSVHSSLWTWSEGGRGGGGEGGGGGGREREKKETCVNMTINPDLFDVSKSILKDRGVPRGWVPGPNVNQTC